MLLSTLILMKVVGPRPPGFGARLVLVGAMLGVTLVDRVLGRPADRRHARRPSACPSGRWRPTTPGGSEFGRLHGLSTALMAATVLGGLVLCYWETRE